LAILLDAGVGPQDLVALEAEERRDEVVEEAALVRGSELAVARHGELVLLVARDAPALRRDRLVLTHRQTGARLGVPRCQRNDLPRPQLAEQPRALRKRLRAIDFEEEPAQVVVDLERGVAGRVDAAGDAPFDLPERDLVGDVDRGLQAGAARLLQVVGGRVGRQRAPEHRLTREVEVAAVLQNGPRRHLPGALALEAESADEPVERGGEHVLVRDPRVRTVAACEGDPVAADDACQPFRHLVVDTEIRRLEASRRPKAPAQTATDCLSLPGSLRNSVRQRSEQK
jgi:hypothetical protein